MNQRIKISFISIVSVKPEHHNSGLILVYPFIYKLQTSSSHWCTRQKMSDKSTRIHSILTNIIASKTYHGTTESGWFCFLCLILFYVCCILWSTVILLLYTHTHHHHQHIKDVAGSIGQQSNSPYHAECSKIPFYQQNNDFVRSLFSEFTTDTYTWCWLAVYGLGEWL